jgi:hypothetical protein
MPWWSGRRPEPFSQVKQPPRFDRWVAAHRVLCVALVVGALLVIVMPVSVGAGGLGAPFGFAVVALLGCCAWGVEVLTKRTVDEYDRRVALENQSTPPIRRAGSTEG